MKFTVQEEAAILREMHGHPTPASAVVSVLRAVQDSRGWIDDEALGAVAARTGQSPTEVEEVATFYNLIYRRPVGRHVLHVCDSVSCWMLGQEGLVAHLERRLGVTMGGTTPDGAFTLLTVPCLGACDRAPAMLLDGKLHGPLDPDGADAVLEDARRRDALRKTT